MLHRITDHSGESLVETLAAIVIAILSIAIIVTAIVTASKMTRKSSDTFDEYYHGNNALSTSDEGSKAGDGTLVLTESGDTVYFFEDHTRSVTVVYYQNDSSGSTPVISYDRVPD